MEEFSVWTFVFHSSTFVHSSSTHCLLQLLLFGHLIKCKMDITHDERGVIGLFNLYN